MEDEIVLYDPEWYGLSFKNWSDENGNVVTKIEKGTTGNITLTANWISERNMAIPSNDKTAKAIFFDADHGKYYFIYELGTIENVVISSLGKDDKGAGEALEWNISETVSIEDGIADTIARTVSSSVSHTSGWSESKNWAVSNSSGVSSSISAGLEVEEFGVKAKIDAAIGATASTSESDSRGYGTSGSATGGSTSSDSVSSTVSYKKGKSTTISKKISISGDMPKGRYSYVYAGTVRVYAVVTYDLHENSYYLDTYSVLDDEMYEKRLYEAPAGSTANIESSIGLGFDIPTEDIENYLNSVYYVEYDSNGGIGEMLTSVFNVNEKKNLPVNVFERVGYDFGGWKCNETGVIYADEAEITNITSSNNIVTLHAVWIIKQYTITWNAASGCSITVTRKSSNKEGTLIGQLASGATVYYGDELEIRYAPNSGYRIASKGVESIIVEGNITPYDIYAFAELITYKVTLNQNGGSGGSTQAIVTSQKTYSGSLPSAPNRNRYIFVGYYDSADYLLQVHLTNIYTLIIA